MALQIRRAAKPGEMLKREPAKRRKLSFPARHKDEGHLDFIRSLPCIITGEKAEAAHVSYASRLHGKGLKGIGCKADDRWTIPLCHRLHMEQHAAAAGEAGWWRAQGIADPLVVAMRLYEASGNRDAAMRVIDDARSVMGGS